MQHFRVKASNVGYQDGEPINVNLMVEAISAQNAKTKAIEQILNRGHFLDEMSGLEIWNEQGILVWKEGM